MMTRTRTARPAFTLVELLVATALVIIILTILAVAFGSASATFSQLKAVGDLASKLRTAQDKLRTDLDAPHIDAGDSPAGQKVSDLRYDLLGTAAGANVTTPRAGYFRLEHAAGSTYEGADADGIISTRAAGAHAVEFTVKRTGKTPDQLFTIQSIALTTPPNNYSVTDTAIGTNQFSTNWARVRWQLGSTPTGNVNGVPTYTLYRSVRLLVPEPNPGTPPPYVTTVVLPPADAEVVSATPPAPGPVNPHTLQTVTPPAVRAASPILPYINGQTHYGDDIILSNVTSFQVKAAWVPAAGVRAPRTGLPATVNAPIPDTAGAVTNTQYPFDDLPANPPGSANPRVFDTWSGDPNTAPLRIRVTALEVTIRVYDPKTLMTRQVSFVVQQ